MKSWLGALMLGLGLIADAPALTLKLATLAPDGTQWMKSMRAGAEEVVQRTEGRVELRFYPGGVMGNDQSVIRKIRAGQLQGGALSASGLGSIYPDFQAYSMPLLFDDYREVDLVRPQIDPLISACPSCLTTTGRSTWFVPRSTPSSAPVCNRPVSPISASAKAASPI